MFQPAATRTFLMKNLLHRHFLFPADIYVCSVSQWQRQQQQGLTQKHTHIYIFI